MRRAISWLLRIFVSRESLRLVVQAVADEASQALQNREGTGSARAQQIPSAATVDLARRLIVLEERMGGTEDGIPVERVSSHDPRLLSDFPLHGQTGGDRMSPQRHNYAAGYAGVLTELIGAGAQTEDFEGAIVEIGILKGTGLGIWSELFPRATVIGLDVDTTLFARNRGNLARESPNVERALVYEFDQFNPTFEWWNLAGRPELDLVIDDGYHSTLASLYTLARFVQSCRFSPNARYVVEDIPNFASQVESNFPGLSADSDGEFTVVRGFSDLVKSANLLGPEESN